MGKRGMPTFVAILGSVLWLGIAFPHTGMATTISIMDDTAMGESGLGNFTGKITYSYTDAMTAELEVELTNTSPLANGGYITGFYLNNPDNMITGITLSSLDADFSLLGTSPFQNGVNGPPFGLFDFGAAISGDPSQGIAVGATETFGFGLTGMNLDMLDEQSFVAELSDTSTGGGQGAKFMMVRFQGFNNSGSDKVPAKPATVPVPEPSATLLLGFGLIGLSLGARRKLKVSSRAT